MRFLWMIGVLACTPTAEEAKVSSGLVCGNSSDCLEGDSVCRTILSNRRLCDLS